MAKFVERESEVVRDALLLLKNHVAKSHFKDLSKLPRNGKAASDPSTKAIEDSLIGRLKSIDKIIASYNSSDHHGAKLSHTVPRPITHNNAVSFIQKESDEDPYINPFTGMMVYPPSVNAPGPSGTRDTGPIPKFDTIEATDPFKNTDHIDEDQAYAKVIQVALARGDFESDSEGSDVSGSDANPFNTSEDEVVSDTSSSGTATPSTSVPSTGMRSDDLQSILQDFDEQFYQSMEPLDLDVTGHIPKSLSSQPYTLTSTLSEQQTSQQELKSAWHDNTASTASSSGFRASTVPYLQSHNPWSSQQSVSHQEKANVPSVRNHSTIQVVEDDFQLAIQLAGQIPQDPNDLGIAQGNLIYQQQQELQAVQDEINLQDEDETRTTMAQLQAIQDEINRQDEQEMAMTMVQLQAIQDEINRQDQEEIALTMMQLQTMQDEWNNEWEGTIEAQKIFAQQIAEQEQQKEVAETLKEMRRWQEMFQAQDNAQIEQDRILALSLSEDADLEDDVNPSNLPRPVTQFPESPPQYADIYTNQTTLPVQGTSQEIGHLDAQPHPVAVNRATVHTNASFEQALTQHAQSQSDWQAEVNRNAQAAKAAQQQIENLEAQARRDLELARQVHRQQRDEEERQRQERERRLQEAELRKQQEAEQRRLQEEERRQEAERQKQAAEAARKARIIDCTVCGDEHDLSLVYRFPCTHAYCRDCLTTSIQTAVKSKSAFRCCNHRADLSVASKQLPTKLLGQYTNLLQELDTPNPKYCSSRFCSVFIPPSNIKAGIAKCPKCRTNTCTSCNRGAHAGVCAGDQDGQALLQLSQSRGWKKCPSCGNMVEKSAGCFHMTCRCGHGFCYHCGKSWRSCGGKCER